MNIFAIPAAFLILGGLLLWFLVGARGQWWVKAIFIIIVPLVVVATWLSLNSYKGWPTSSEPTCPLVFLSAEIQEPSANQGTQGHIYLWMRPFASQERSIINLFDYKPSSYEPRAYELPYSRELHQALDNIRRASEGKKIILECDQRQGTSRRSGQGTGETPDGGSSYGGFTASKQKFIFYELPPPELPQKRP